MKLVVEIEIDDDVEFNPNNTKEQIVKYLNSKVCGKINELLLNESLDDSKFVAEYKNKRWVDLILDCKAVDIK